jgi:hypothetical protein
VSSDFDGRIAGSRNIGAGASGAALEGTPASPLWNPAGLHDLGGPVFSIDFDAAQQSQLNQEALLAGQSLRGKKTTYLGFMAHDAGFFYRPLANYRVRRTTDPVTDFSEDSLTVNQFGLCAVDKGDRPGVSMGVTLSYVNAQRGRAAVSPGQAPRAEVATGNGFSADVGVLYRGDPLSVGAAVFNAPGIIYWNLYKPDQLPTVFRGGFLYRPVSPFAFTTDYEKRWYRGGVRQPGLWHGGVEATVASWLTARAGLYGEDLNDGATTSYTYGISVASPKQHTVDLAVRQYRQNDVKALNYFITLGLPLPAGTVSSSGDSP